MAKKFSIAFQIGAALSSAFKSNLASAESQFKRLRAEVNRLKASQKQVDRFKTLRRSMEDTKKQIAAANTEIARLEHLVASTDKPSKRLVNNLKSERAHAAGLNKRLREQGRDLSALRSQMGDAAKSTSSLARHQVRLTNALKKTKAAQQDLNRIMRRRQQNLLKRQNLRGQLWDAAALGAAVYAPVKAAIDFESAMADVKKVVDFETPAQFEKMRTDLLGVTRILPMATDELAQIMAAAGQAGIARQELLRFAVDAGKMGVAFDMAGKESGAAMTGMRSIFALNQDQVVLLGDSYNYLSNNMDATAREIVGISNRVGPMGKLFGLTGQQVGALGATFLALKTSPEVAATGINALLQKLSTADQQSREFQDALTDLGMDAEELKDAIKEDAQGALLKFLETVENSDDVMGTLSSLFGAEYADDIAKLTGGLDTYRKALSLVGNQSAYSGSMLREYEERSKTTANSLQLFRNRISELGINIGSVLLPSINALAGAGGEVASGLATLAQKFPTVTKFVVGLTAGIMAFRVAVIAGGYALTFLKGGVLNIVSVYKAFRSGLVLSTAAEYAHIVAQKASVLWTNLVAGAQWALNAAFIASPIGWITAAVGALVGVGVLLWKNWDRVVAVWHRFTAALDNPIIRNIALVFAPFITIPALIMKHWEPIKTFFTDLFGTIGKFAEKISDLWPFKNSTPDMKADLSVDSLRQGIRQSNATTNMSIAPTIHVAAGADYNQVRAAVDAGMGDSERRFKDMMDRYMINERRLVYV